MGQVEWADARPPCGDSDQRRPGAGSWDVTDPHGNAGGRIYQTALSLLTLEVYYRHLPIYRRFDADATPSKDSVSVAKP